ncbi:Importin-11 [Entophlyctis sp. JEL0112]|nr:Importin-11 [Entophlyctis sp. JEL0112]
MESQTRAQLAQLLVALAAGSNSALEAQLEAILAVHMHHALLLHISADPSVPYSARHLAALHVKNGIDRHWRKTSKSSLAADEKAEIRSFVLTLVSEESAKLLRAYAETIAKIAQMDYPHEWPEVVPTLLAAIESSLDPSSQIAQLSSQNPQDLTALKRVHVTQQHCLYTLHRVTKAMYSVKTLRVKHVMYQMAPQLTQYLCSLFTSNISSFITNFSAAVQSNISDEISIEKLDGLVQIARLSLKILRRLLVNGFPERADMVRVNGSSVGTASGTAVQAPEFYTPFEKVEACVNLISSLTGYLKSLLEIRMKFDRPQTSSFKSIEQATSKICITAGKLYTDLIQSRPVAFVGCRGGLDVVRYYWELVAMGDSSGNLENYSPAGNKDGFVDRVLLQGMIIFRGVVKNSQFSLLPPDRHPHTDDAIKLIASQILTPDFVSSAAQLLVTKYLILTAEELEKWDEDPEGFMTDEEADQWEFSLRMCAQKALMDLASKHRTIVSPLLMSMLQHVSDLSPQSNSSAILLKDAVYAAVGYCAYDLFDFMEFDQWFEQKLLKECTEQTPQTNPLWKIIRRRVPMLVSYWIAVKSEPRMRPLFYRVLLHLASAENEKDLVVRLSAVTTLRVVVDEGLLTDSEIFQPFVETCVKVLVELVVAAEDFETKSNCLQTLKSIIYMMGQKVERATMTFLDRIKEEKKGCSIMFRTSILLVLTTLVQALKEQSIMLHPLVLPAIQNTLLGSNTSQQMHFLEDSIDLWTATLKNTPSLTPELVSLYSSLSNLIELGSFEHLKVVLRLVESYFVLDAAAFVQHPDSLPLFSKISECLSELRMDATKHISRTLALVVQTSLQSNSVAALQRLLIEAKLLQTLLTEILQSRTKGIVDHIVADFSTIVLRVAVWDVAFVMNFLQEFGVAVGNGASLLPECLEIWIKVYDAMTYPKQRKTMALAFATLVATGRPEVLAQLQAIMGVLSSVLAEVHGLSVEE